MLFHIDSHLLQEKENSHQKVSQRLVIHNSFLYGLSNFNPLQILQVHLMLGTVKRQFNGTVFLKFGMPLIERVHEMLDFCHLELSHSNQPVSRRNLVPEAQSDLGSSKGQSSSVELQQFMEIHEHSLRSLRPQVSHEIRGGSNLGLKHQIEGFRSRQLITRIGRFDLQLDK